MSRFNQTKELIDDFPKMIKDFWEGDYKLKAFLIMAIPALMIVFVFVSLLNLFGFESDEMNGKCKKCPPME